MTLPCISPLLADSHWFRHLLLQPGLLRVFFVLVPGTRRRTFYVFSSPALFPSQSQDRCCAFEDRECVSFIFYCSRSTQALPPPHHVLVLAVMFTFLPAAYESNCLLSLARRVVVSICISLIMCEDDHLSIYLKAIFISFFFWRYLFMFFAHFSIMFLIVLSFSSRSSSRIRDISPLSVLYTANAFFP